MYQGVLDNLVKGKLRRAKNGPFETGPWAILDLDGVVTSTKHIKRTEDDFGEPLEKVAEMIDVVREAGYRVLLFTTRKISQGVVFWLHKQGLDFEGILSFETKKNPYAGILFEDDNVIYIDEDDMDASLLQLKQVINIHEKKVKAKFGRTVREANEAMREHRIKEKTVYTLKGQIAPLQIVGKRKE